MRSRAFVAGLLIVASLVHMPMSAVLARGPHHVLPAGGASTNLRLNLDPGAGEVILDPAWVGNGPSRLVVNQLFLALVRPDDETGAPLPELATSWTMSPDATVFTFTLRSGVTWTDGQPVTAGDVRYGILRTLDPAAANSLAYTLYNIRNAEAYNNGLISDPDEVGITVLDPTHLRFVLERPAAYFPGTLALPTARPMPSWAIETYGDDWTRPEHIVTNGAYRLTGWDAGVSLTLEKNPGYYDAAKVQIERVSFTIVDEATAWGMYLAGQLDSVHVPGSEWDAARGDPALLPYLHAAPLHGTYYYGFNTAQAPFDDARVRRAFVAATNRQGLVDLMAGLGTTAHGLPLALTYTAPGIWGHVDGEAAGIGIPYNPAQAQSLLAQAGYPGGAGLPTVTIVYNSSAGHEAIAGYVAESWRDVLSATVVLSPTATWGEHQALLCSDPPQVWRLGWTYDHYDAYNFLYDGLGAVACGRTPFGDWTNTDYDDTLALAAETADLQQRSALYAAAEGILVETDAVMLPLYYYGRGIATRPNLQRSYCDGGFGGRIADWRLYGYVYLPLVLRS